jgi:hypothetical protein
MTVTTSATFTVANVERATNPLPEIAYKEAIDRPLGAVGHSVHPREIEVDRLLNAKLGQAVPPAAVEACSRYHGRLVAGVEHHALIAALDLAYRGHRPVSLSPDMIWLLICQGVAQHINAHAETVRSQFVRHQGQLPLEVRRDDFVKGSPENPWPEVFSEFSRTIKEHIGRAHDLLVANFSTTGPAERAASEIVLLSAVQQYFRFGLKTFICGIPEIALEGTVADWQAIVERVEGFATLGLDWWLKPLRSILRQFVRAARGDVDRAFWRSIYRIQHPDRPYNPVPPVGWIAVFFPYLDGPGQATSQNPWMAGGKDLEELLTPLDELFSETSPQARTTSRDWTLPAIAEGLPDPRRAYSTGLAKAPFTWGLLDGRGNVVRQYDMEFLGGFVGVAQDPHTLGLRPEIGWAIREATR